jgi:CubicO group peptidase (beta-lactamase class C family)
MVVVHSATKGLAAMTLAVAHSRGWLDYDERVATYWPEFAQQGKERITVRQLLAHQAGLFAFDEPVDRNMVADLDRLAAVMARHRPAWAPGTRQAYHALTLGFYEGELIRRIDPGHRTLGQFFHDEIAMPLGEDIYLRLPEELPDSRLATLSAPGRLALLLGFPLRLTRWRRCRRHGPFRAPCPRRCRTTCWCRRAWPVRNGVQPRRRWAGVSGPRRRARLARGRKWWGSWGTCITTG